MRKIDRPLTLESVKFHRKDNCIHYDGCLEEASALLWPSFSCQDCKLFMEKRNSVVYGSERAASPIAWEV